MRKNEATRTIYDLDYEVGKIAIGNSELNDLIVEFENELKHLNQDSKEITKVGIDKLELAIKNMNHVEKRLQDAVENINKIINELCLNNI